MAVPMKAELSCELHTSAFFVSSPTVAPLWLAESGQAGRKQWARVS